MTPTPPPADAARFDAVWRDWDVPELRAGRIAQHVAERDRFLGVLGSYVRRAAPARVAEIGCGSAIDLALLRREAGTVSVGIDLSAEALGVARRFASHLDVPVDFVVGDAARLPFPDKTFGLVFSQGLLEHFRPPLPRAVLAEQARLVAPGGVLIVSVPQTYTGYTLHKRRAIRAGRWPWGWEDQYSSGTLRRLGESLGLVTEQRFGYQYWRSWSEPAWVLRDLVGKVERRLPRAAARAMSPVAGAWDAVWRRLETRFGHRFLLNVVVVFRRDGCGSGGPATSRLRETTR